ncbi:DUF3392 domain-containing protein [Photobacterium minamisatsumaniensis]|uniref:DUF3392 domain-containing protein n=1 Tax=Photobacterium minamisatsumaniensis TaxID=2910233 RepID=UPI003D0EB9DE
MNYAISLIADFGHWLRPWLLDISTAIIACLLVIFGSDINRILRKQLSSTHFIIRTTVFILVHSFGYGFLIIKASPFLSQQLEQLPNHWLVGFVTIAFIVVGAWAQRNRQFG